MKLSGIFPYILDELWCTTLLAYYRHILGEVDVSPFSTPMERQVLNQFSCRGGWLIQKKSSQLWVEWGLDPGGTGVDSTFVLKIALCSLGSLVVGGIRSWGHPGALCHRHGHLPTVGSQLGPGAVRSHAANTGVHGVMRATEPCQNLPLHELPYSWLGCSTPGPEV